ncbi:MAG: hypothetical protein WDN46_04550 [Methylocella sp.]
MTAIIPIGFVTLDEAAEMIAKSLYMGVEDGELVATLRQSGLNVRDGQASDAAISEIWRAADAGRLRVVGIGGNSRKIVRLDPEDLKEIPLLRSPRGGNFHFLRPSNRLYGQVTKWFGPQWADAVIAFREKEVAALTRFVLRTRRKHLTSGDAKKSGRPTLRPEMIGVIKKTIEAGKWNPTMSLKALTRLVNVHGGLAQNVSEDTVTRGLDDLFDQTGDRRFQRRKKAQRGAR